MYYFLPYYSDLDLEHDLMMYILGRYEFENKGIDVFIKSLGILDKKLREMKSNRTVSVFFWIIREQKEKYGPESLAILTSQYR